MFFTYSETDKKVNYKTNNQKRNEHKLQRTLTNIAFPREIFNQYFMINISIKVTANSQTVI